MKSRRASLFASAALGVVLAAIAMPVGASAPEFTVGDHDGYGRLVFDLKDPVPYRAAVRDGHLVVEFENPVRIPADRAARHLGEYVRAVHEEDDGRRFVFDLKRAVRLRESTLGHALVIDLVDLPEPQTVSGADADEVAPVDRVERPHRADAIAAARRDFAATGDWTAPLEPVRAALVSSETKEATRPDPYSTRGREDRTRVAGEHEAGEAGDPATGRETVDDRRIRIRVGEHPGFVRVVFDWTRSVGYELVDDDEGLRIRFDRDAVLDASKLESWERVHVEPIVGRHGDGSAAAFPRAEGGRHRAFESGTFVVVDLIGSAFDSADIDYEPVRVRAETAADAPHAEDASATTIAEKSGTTSAPTVTSRVADAASAVAASADHATSGVSPAVASRMATETAVAAAPPVWRVDDTDARDGASTRPQTAPAVPAPRPRRAGASAAEALPPPPAASVAAVEEEARPVSPDLGPEGASMPRGAAADSVPPWYGVHEAPGGGRAEAAAPDLMTHADVLAALSLGTHALAEEAEDLAAVAAEPSASLAEEAMTGRVSVERDGTRVVIGFPFPPDVPAAVFRRGGLVWLVFEQRSKLDLSELEELAGDWEGRVATVDAEGATVLHLPELPDRYAVVRADAPNWTLEWRLGEDRRAVSLAVNPEPYAPAGPRLVVPVEDSGTPIRLYDSRVGDRLVAVPTRQPGIGILQPHDYPEVRVHSSVQGVVVAPHADRIRVREEDAGVVITAPEGLLMSDLPTLRRLLEKGGSSGVGETLDPKAWRRSGETFARARQALQARLASAEPFARDAARLDLARFHFARGMGAEALAILRSVAEHHPEILDRSDYRILRGASAVLANRIDEAEVDLFMAALDGSAHAALWRGMVHAHRGRNHAAASAFREGWSVVREYGDDIRARLGAEAAEAALAARRTRLAGEFVVDLSDVWLEPGVRSRLRLVHARSLVAEGAVDDGRRILQEVSEGPDRRARAAAELSLAMMDYYRATASPEDVEATLDRLRFAWRGDALELDTLEALAQVRLDEGDYHGALASLRQAVDAFADRLDTTAIRDRMSSIFRRLFVDGEAREMEPIEAVTLYEEFRELTPIGRDGDRVLRDLAGRLVALDLFGPAAELIEHQVRFRLDGEERAAEGANLALIHLLARHPVKALDALDVSDTDNLSEELERQRRDLRVQALAAVGRETEGLALLEGDSRAEADELRAELYWRLERWRDAAVTLAGMLPELPEADTRLDEEAAALVLKYATALALDGDDPALAVLGDEWGAAMRSSSREDAFVLLTEGRRQRAAGIAAARAALAGADALARQVERYRAGFSSEGDDMPTS